MNYLNKKTKIKIMSQILLGMTVTGIGISSVTNNDIIVAYATNEGGNISSKSIFSDEVKEIATSEETFFFLENDGTVWAMGKNDYGQLGIVNKSYITSPVQVPIDNVKAIYGNEVNTFFLKNDGSIWATGKNSDGQLGIGNTTGQTSPVQVLIDDVKEIKMDNLSTFFIKNDGSIWATGYNEAGRLGIGHTDKQLTPVQVPITDVKEIKYESYSTFFIKNDGTIWACGNNSSGELGIGNTTNQLTPVQVPITDVKEIKESYTRSTFFIKNDGSVWTCGKNLYGELGIYVTGNNPSPLKVKIEENVKDIIRGNYSTIFVTDDGTSYICGLNDRGQLGIGTNQNQSIPTEMSITGIREILNDYQCLSKAYYILNDGTVWASGSNTHGELGIGNKKSQLSLNKVLIDNVKKIIYNNAGYTFFIKNDGTVWACGDNSYGRLGVQSSNVTTPEKVPIKNVYNVNVQDKTATTFNSKVNGLLLTHITEKNTSGNVRLLNRTSNLENETSYTISKLKNNLKDYGEYGSLCSTIYGNSKYDFNQYDNELEFTCKNTLPTLTNISLDESELRIKEILPNGSMVIIDNYGAVQFYQTLTSSAIDIRVDGSTINSIKYGMLDQTPVCLFYKNDGSIWYFEPTGTTISLKMLPIEQSEINGTTPYLDKNAQIKYFLFEKTDGELVYFDTNRFEQSVGINMNDVQAIVPSTSINSTMYLMKDGTLKYLSNGTATDVTLPDSLSITSMMSNRFFTMSDGYVYAIFNNTVVETGVLASATQNACNNILWMKNGQIRTINMSDRLYTLSDVNGKLVKTIVPLDNNNAYILNKDGSTYGVGNLVATTDLLNSNINYDEIAGFISNNTDYKYDKILVMKDGTVYENPSSWTKSTKIHFDGEALLEIQDNFDVSFDMLSQATNAVITAEKTKLQANLDYAQSLVSALDDSSEKTALQARLDVLQELINKIAEATKAVEKAETSKSAIDKDLAQTLVTALPDCTQKTELQDRLNAIVTEKTPLEIATDLVEKAETTKIQTDVDEARDKVNALPDGTEKDDLVSRLDKVQEEIDKKEDVDDEQKLQDATDSVEKAEGSLSQDDLDEARDKVNALPDGTEKDDLIDRLDKVQEEIDNTQQENEEANNKLQEATQAVEKAEGSLSQDDVDTAQDLVNKLPNGTDKDNLQDRLDKVQEEIDKAQQDADNLKDATEKVEIAEDTKSKDDVDTAQSAINKLPNGTDKDNLQDRLDKVKEEIAKKEEADRLEALIKDATEKVEKAEDTKSKVDVSSAQSAINKLPDGTIKDDLQNRLDKIKQEIADKEEQDKYDKLLDEAIKAMEKAESTKNTIDINKAQSAINKLPNGDDKNNLQERLDKLKAQIEEENKLKAQLTYAEQLVGQAERMQTSNTLNTAKDYVNTLPDGNDKTALLNRLQTVEDMVIQKENASKFTYATQLVEQAERRKTQTTINKARDYVNTLPDCSAKTELLNRLNRI